MPKFRSPLRRTPRFHAREGVSLETSTLSGWIGATAAALNPLVDALAAEIMGPDALHVDDTPVPVPASGTGKTKTGRLWVYVRDERAFAGGTVPLLGRSQEPALGEEGGEHPRAHLKEFTGVIEFDRLKNLPANDTVPGARHACQNRRYSVVRAPRSWKGTPRALNSASFHPAPTPAISRPPDIRSSVAKLFAVTIGLRYGMISTDMPKRMRLVFAATSKSATSGVIGIGPGG